MHKLDALLIAAADRVAAFVHDAMASGAASVKDEKRLLQAFVAQPWDSASAPERNGRPAEPDDKLLWEMALLRADKPSLSHREAAKETLANFSPGEHSEDGAVDRLRKKYGKCADLLEDAVAHIQHNHQRWDLTQGLALNPKQPIGGWCLPPHDEQQRREVHPCVP